MATAGYTTQGATTVQVCTTVNDDPIGLLITLPTSGVLTNASGYADYTTTPKPLSFQIYSGTAGNKGSLLYSSSTSNTSSTSFTLEGRTFTSPLLGAGTYWLQMNISSQGPGTGVGNATFDTGGASNTGYQLSDVGVPTYNTNQYGMYITYTPLVGVVGNGSFLLIA